MNIAPSRNGVVSTICAVSGEHLRERDPTLTPRRGAAQLFVKSANLSVDTHVAFTSCVQFIFLFEIPFFITTECIGLSDFLFL